MASSTAKEILRLLLQAGVMGANANPLYRAALSAGGVPSHLADNISRQDMKAFMAKQYPDEFTPGAFHNYKVEYGLNNPKHGSDIIKKAGIMQTLEEHNDAIQQFVKQLPPGADPKTVRAALNRGLEAEKKLDAFWNESESRVPFSVQSSAVDGIRLTPDARIEVKWRSSPSWYTFKQYPNTYDASKAAQKLLQEPSIGRAVWPVISRQPKKREPDLGSWNYSNYDGAFA